MRSNPSIERTSPVVADISAASVIGGSPFIRASCDAHHCGKREFLHDDFDAVTLEPLVVRTPAIDLWPQVIRRVKVPPDVESLLLSALEGEGSNEIAF